MTLADVRIDADIENDGLLWLQMQNSGRVNLGVWADVKNYGGEVIVKKFRERAL